jgi:hypothetical protein
MAKSGFLKKIRKNSSLKKITYSFIFIALVFILSSVYFFIFKNYNIENLDNENKNDISGNSNDISGNSGSGTKLTNDVSGNSSNTSNSNTSETKLINDGTKNKINRSRSRLEVALITSDIKKHREHTFLMPNGDWDKLVNKYRTNPKITMRTIDRSKAYSELENININYSSNDLPMVVFSIFLNDKRHYGGQLKDSQVSFNSIDSYLNLLLNDYIL